MKVNARDENEHDKLELRKFFFGDEQNKEDQSYQGKVAVNRMRLPLKHDRSSINDRELLDLVTDIEKTNMMKMKRARFSEQVRNKLNR